MLRLLAGVAAVIVAGSTVSAAAAAPPTLQPLAQQHRFGTPVPKRAVEPATLVTQVIDRYGKPGNDTSGHAVDVATGEGEFLRFDERGVAKTLLAPGTYDVSVLSNTVGPDGVREFTAATSRRVVVTAEGGRTTVDARPARPVTAKVDRPGATVVDSSVTVATKVGDTGFGNTYFTGPGARVYAVPTAGGGLQTFVYRPMLGGPGFRYHLVHVSEGRLPNAPVYYTPDARLARFDTTYYAQGRAETGVEGNNGKPAAVPGLSIFRYMDLEFPGTRTEYYTADPSVTWFTLRVLGSDAAYTDAPFRPGATKSTWFRTPVQTAWGDGITRSGNELTMSVQPFAPADGKRYQGRFGAGDEGKTVLLKDGVEIGANDTVGTGQFTLPAERGRYTLRTSGTRVADHSNLDTSVLTEWTFDSAEGTTKLPLSLVRVGIGRDASGASAQNQLGQVRTGSNHELTLAADHQPGSAAARTGIPSLDVSYDDGKTWRRAAVGWGGQRGNAWLVEPAAPGFVSLRVSATNSDGSRFSQTLIRAYELI